MPHDRFFLDAPFQTDAELLLLGEEAHHLNRVMRKKTGEKVELVNGRNQLAQASLLGIEKKGVRLRLLGIEERQPPANALILCQAIPRLNRLDTIVEKGTELGMTELWLFPGQLSEKQELSVNQLHRLEYIAIAAMKQSGRLDLPKIIVKPPLNQWPPLSCPAYFGDLRPHAPPLLSCIDRNNSRMFFVGPEAGFTPAEEALLLHLQVTGVRIHANILRVDTAALVALALISN